jgi:ATP-dependent Clp protease ATP-binding subunit ClpC
MLATGTPLSCRLTLERDQELARNVEPVSVSASSEVETAEIVQAKKEKFEMFHGIVLSAEAVETAISVSGRFLRNRTLPDRVLDLIDETGALVKVRRETPPLELALMQRRLRAMSREAEHAIFKHDFDRAKRFSEQERDIREEMTRFREQSNIMARANPVLTGETFWR